MTEKLPPAKLEKRDPRKQLQSRLDTALVIALVPVIASALRVWMYSGGDVSLFLSLLRTIDVVTVLVGTSMVIIPGLIGLLLLILLTDRDARQWVEGKLEAHPLLGHVLLPVVFFALAYTLSWNILLLLIVASVIYFIITLFVRWVRSKRASGKPKKIRKSEGPETLPIIVSCLASLLIAPSHMWLPLEVVSIEDEELTGYVLDVSSEWTTVLSSDREIHITPSSRVTDRKVCSWEGSTSIALFMQRGGLKNAPDCSRH